MNPSNPSVQSDETVRPWTTLILAPLIGVLVVVLGWATGQHMSALAATLSDQNNNYRPADEAFFQRAERFYDTNKVAPGVVRVPPGQEAYLLAQQWAFVPELRLQVGVRYIVWVAATDVPHSFTLRDQDLNLLLTPGYAYQVEFMFEEPGQYAVSCTEYCGLGHAGMFGRIIVEP